MTPEETKIIEEWEQDFTDLYGLEDPTRTFRDHDDFLIIRDNFKSTLLSAIHRTREETLKEVAEEVEKIIKECDKEEWSEKSYANHLILSKVLDLLANKTKS